MTILQKTTLTLLILLCASSLYAIPELTQLAETLSEILVSVAGKTGAEILVTQEAALSQAFSDPASIDTTPGSALIKTVNRAIAELEDALAESSTVKFSDKSAEQDIKTRNSIFSFATVVPNVTQESTLSKEIAAIQKNIKPLHTITGSQKKITSLGYNTLKNLPNQLTEYKKITEAQKERRIQIKQNYETAITNKNESVKNDAKKQLEKLLKEYAPLEGIVNSLRGLIASIKFEIESLIKSTASSHAENTLIERLTEIASREIYPFSREELIKKIADKATAPGDRSLYTQMKTNLEATNTLLVDVKQAINATQSQLGDTAGKINNLYNFVVEIRDRITKNAPGTQQYMNDQKFNNVPGTIKNIFSRKLGTIALSKSIEETLKGGTEDTPGSTKKFTQAEIAAIKLIPGQMVSLAGEDVDAITESREKNLEELISRQEKIAPQEGAKSRATFNAIKEIRATIKDQKLTDDKRKEYVENTGTALSEEIRNALAGKSEWD